MLTLTYIWLFFQASNSERSQIFQVIESNDLRSKVLAFENIVSPAINTKDTALYRFLWHPIDSMLDHSIESELIRKYSNYYSNKLFLNQSINSRLKILDRILEVAVKNHQDYMILIVAFQKAWLYTDTADYIKAFEQYLTGYDLSEKLGGTAINHTGYYLYTLSQLYYRFKDYDQALYFAKKSFEVKHAAWVEVQLSELAGKCCHIAHQYDSARWWFAKCDSAIEYRHDFKTGWHGIVAGNIGNTYYEEKNYEKAIPYLLQGITQTAQDKLYDNTCLFASLLADIYTNQEKYTQARQWLDTAQKYTYTHADDHAYLTFYSSLSNFYKKTNKPILALTYQDSLLSIKNKLDQDLDISKKMKAELSNFQSKRKEQENQMNDAIHHQKTLRNALMLLILCVFSFALYMQAHQRKKHKKQHQTLSDEKLKVESDLQSAITQLNTFTANIKEKNALIDQYTSQINRQINDQQDDQLKTIETLKNSAILTNSDWVTFRSLVDTVHIGFFDRLKAKMPDLTQAEIRFATLTRLQLDGKEMAAMLGVSNEAIRSTRSRLKKKLQLGEEEDLNKMILEV